MSTPARDVAADATADADVVSAAPTDADELAQVLSFLEAHEARRGVGPAAAFYLSGVEKRDRVELTGQVHAILKQVVAALSRGQSISILTRDQEITTQQAAEVLGVSRPTVVRLIEDGELPAHVPGTERRKLLLADVLAYREQLRARRNRFITKSSAAYEEAEPADTAALLAQARKSR
jgi:excisionase family DNA binding protein